MLAAGCGSSQSPKPPQASIQSGGTSVAMTLAGYCWTGSGVAVCADGGELTCNRSDPVPVATVAVGDGDRVTVRLGFDFRTVVADAAGRPVGATVAGSEVVLSDLPKPGSDGLVLRLVATADGGDAAYWACLRAASG